MCKATDFGGMINKIFLSQIYHIRNVDSDRRFNFLHSNVRKSSENQIINHLFHLFLSQ